MVGKRIDEKFLKKSPNKTVRFAYVEYKEGARKNKKMIVTTDFIDHDFNKKPLRKDIKYLLRDEDGTRTKAQIFFIEDTEAQLQEKIKKASRKDLAIKALGTASESELPAVSASQKLKAKVDSDKKKEEKKKSYAKLLMMKKSDLNQVLNDQSQKSTAARQNTSAKTSNNKRQIAVEIDSDYAPTPAKIHRNESALTTLNNSSNIDETFSSEEKSMESFKKRSEKVDDTDERQTRKRKSFLHDVQNGKKEDDKFKKLEKENKKLKQKIEFLENSNYKFECENTKYKDLNFKLQAQVIDTIQERNEIDKQLQAAASTSADTSNIDHKQNFTPVGWEKPGEKKVHIGRGKFIDAEIYSLLIGQSKSPLTCVSNVLKSQFKIETLLNSTLSGRKSNRHAGDKAPLPHSLNPCSLLICKDFYDHWLETRYKSIIPAKYTYDFKILSKKFEGYVSKAISYLKAPKQPKRTVKKPKNDKGARKSENKDNGVNNESDSEGGDNQKILEDSLVSNVDEQDNADVENSDVDDGTEVNKRTREAYSSENKDSQETQFEIPYNSDTDDGTEMNKKTRETYPSENKDSQETQFEIEKEGISDAIDDKHANFNQMDSTEFINIEDDDEYHSDDLRTDDEAEDSDIDPLDI